MVGTAVVKAAYTSPQVIVIMTLATLAFFSAPLYELTAPWRLVGLGLLLAAALLGMLGLVLATMVFIAVLTGMRSFGTPYFEPWAPFRWQDWKDVLWRVPWADYRTRLSAARPLQRVTGNRPRTQPVHLRRGRQR
ncbi:protein of unknown function [Candidatus Hydrogenisulfobacillus filiaventi]|uniref:Uncharacterized protein n=1 Tax=Candidatus Hydrogenisulfobacillus filiaventi TaxID=2707344 RepID=A0A6F8ZFR7_9FIRM|nr:protein of unknown function [Candidatus Hydrogenisulfobacillus filiaventi]